MTNTNHAARGLAAFGLAALPLAVHAQSNAADLEAVTVALNPMVVTAALAPRTADQSLSSVTVIDEATLRRQDPASITEVLRGQPGVDTSSNGGFGKASSVYIRGTKNNQSLLMIDGIRLRSASTGGAAWQYLEPRMFERVEIVRGPRGSLYGADAVGGVVQLFTPEGEGEPMPQFSFGGGSFNTKRASASLSGSEGGTRYVFSASRLDTDGYEIVDGEGDKGYDNTTGLVRLSHVFNNGAELGMLGLRARGNTEYDRFGTPADTDYAQQVAGLYGELPITDDWSSRLTLSESRDESDNHDSFGGSVFDTRTRTALWENTLTLGFHQLIMGAEYVDDSIEGSDTGFGSYDVESRYNKAVFTQGLLDFSPFTVQASLRFDHNQVYGDEVTGGLSLGYALDDRHTLRASYGTAFRAPSFDELYYPGFNNPDLAAERSKNIELGLRGQVGQGYWDLALFQNDIDDLITNVDTTGDGFVDTPINVSRARIRGMEIATGADIEQWTLRAALTYTDPENRDSGKRLQRRASQSLRLDADREMGDWSLGASWIAQNHRYNDSANQQRLPGYGIVNLRAGWDFAPMWSTRLTVENAFDKEYETARDYISAGRAAFVSVHFGQ
ncbi:TonB-dependent receptor [Halomonas aestuarii]|uniref:TonB-dependent receptor n=1 Tax=Halomonas aestuarii TaxID=1897729 RepID=A0A1J0VCZ3_9GAMM|nr:TonB-dependent receptor [Halomonas aestuarii]APE29901.1 TonB-dependent receptor [Halomonas aestuarii]